jgi:putative heme-binding domain-containing protein
MDDRRMKKQPTVSYLHSPVLIDPLQSVRASEATLAMVWKVARSTLMPWLVGLVVWVTINSSITTVVAQQSEWIWSPKIAAAAGNPQGDCYYRKKFSLVRPQTAELELSAGDEFEVYINGQLAARGQSYGSPNQVKVESMLVPGINLIAAKVRHLSSDQIGLSAKLRIKEIGENRWRSLSTDGTWKTRDRFVEGWQKTSYNDMGWVSAQKIDRFNRPSGGAETLADADRQSKPRATSSRANTKLASMTVQHGPMIPKTNGVKKTEMDTGQLVSDGRFDIDPEFVVQEVLSPAETGSLIAMEFNEFGQLLLSREGGPLLVADTTLQVGDPARVRVCCESVTSCQGILPLNGNIFVTAQGPEGLGLYRLTDKDRDGVMETTKKMLGFTGQLGEHGPHGIQLGPDGMIYVIVGNGSQLEQEVAATSPYRHWYEGDLVPRYEDPGGHAVGVKAPGGTIIRMSVDGAKVERVAGGIRNAYDLVFDERGELFIHDSDMESDKGTTWYRPTQVYHVPAGSEMGWRSGWSKFSQHFIDQNPALCDTGPGSPTGAVLYQHLQFPIRYQDSLFLADWSEGRIIALRKQPAGAGFVAVAETFLSGKPMNVCDLAIAEDGAMYFCTGGRGTSGGVYRVVWNGKVPDKMLTFESDLARVIRQPQPGSAWGRQSISQLKKQLGENWSLSLEGVATETRNPAKFRIRALQLMVLYGPAPTESVLDKLAADSDADVRGEVARLCGLKGGEHSIGLLAGLLADENPRVRRLTCESYLRLGVEPSLGMILPMLSSLDRVETLSARRLLERSPVEKWESEVFSSDDKRVFIQGAVAMLTAEPTLERSYLILAQVATIMDSFINDRDFADLLRVAELALAQGGVDPARVPGLAVKMGNEFPSGNALINQELARILAYLKVGDFDGRMVDYMKSQETSLPDRVHTAMYLQTVGSPLTNETRLAIIDCLESARTADEVGDSYAPYLKRAVEDVSATMSPSSITTVLQNGSRWPNAVLAAFYKLPDQLDQATVQQVIQLDQEIRSHEDAASQRLRLGVIAMLARSPEPKSMEYLRQLWQSEESRRNDIVIGLAQQPEGENWPYLVTSIPVLDDLTGREVVKKLSEIPRRPREAQHFRDVIELGYRLRNHGADDVVDLLEFWSAEQPQYAAADWQSKLSAWQTWFAQQWPDESAIVVQSPPKTGRHAVIDVLSYLENNGLGDAKHGQHLFNQAKCAICHRVGSSGQNVGPDLTSLSTRLTLREVLEATFEPSQTISDRYQSKFVVTADGDKFNGMAVKQSDGGYVILQADGQRIRIPPKAIEEVIDDPVSSMPTGLLDGLSESEIADLMAFILVAREDQMAQQIDHELESR